VHEPEIICCVLSLFFLKSNEDGTKPCEKKHGVKKTADNDKSQDWMVVSNIFYFHPYLAKIPILTHIFQVRWFNHQLEDLTIDFEGLNSRCDFACSEMT